MLLYLDVSTIAIFGVASSNASEMFETARRNGQEVEPIDNLAFPNIDLTTVQVEKLDSELPIIVAPGMPEERSKALSNALKMGATRFTNLIDPNSSVASTVKIGCGNYINTLVSIGAETLINCHTNINRGSSIAHHCYIGSFVATGPGAIVCGNVSVDVGTFIGAGAIILPKIKVGRNVLIGAGAVVTKDLSDNVVVVGNPAKIIRKQNFWEGLDKCPTH